MFGIQCTCTCHLLRARLATAEEVTARRNLAFNPYDCHGSHRFQDCNTKIGGTETQRIITIKRTLKDLQLLYLFLPGKLMASTARLSFFYRHHSAYRIQEMPNHNSSTWENESELIHFFASRFLDESKLIHSGGYATLYAYWDGFLSFLGECALQA